jgi:IS30 family transposase
VGTKHLTKSELERIAELYRETLSTREVARRLSLPLRRVTYTVKRLGFRLTRAQGGAVYRRKGDVLRWAREGLSFSEIARRIGTKHQLVSRFLRENGFEYVPFRQAGANNPAWRGGRMVDKDGYVLIYQPTHPHASRHGYVREHRLVMEKHLRRYLDPKEVVHHKNEIRDDNRLSNLELFPSNGDHLRAELTGKKKSGRVRRRRLQLRESRLRLVQTDAASRRVRERDDWPS